MTGIVVGTGKGHHWRRVPWRVVLLVLGVIVVAGGAGAGVNWWQTSKKHDAANKPDPIAKAAATVTNQIATGDYDKAHDTIKGALADPKLSAEEKYQLYMNQGAVYENEKEFGQAIESYKKAEESQNTFDAAQSIARSAELKGDKETAITYYKKAITLLPKDALDDLKVSYENAIIRLGGKP